MKNHTNAPVETNVDIRGIDYTTDIENGISVCREILASPEGAIFEKEWLLARIRAYGLAYVDWPILEYFNNWKNPSAFGLLQYPPEFADFLITIARLKPNTGVEIGVWRGASSYLIAAVLQRANPDYSHTMIDIEDNIFGWKGFSSFLNLTKAIPSTSNDFRGNEFDFVFIDADHSYDGANTDYLNLGRYARKAVAFHDIHGHEYDHESGGIVRAWREFKAANNMKMRIVEFAQCPQPWMGIGVGIQL